MYDTNKTGRCSTMDKPQGSTPELERWRNIDQDKSQIRSNIKTTITIYPPFIFSLKSTIPTKVSHSNDIPSRAINGLKEFITSLEQNVITKTVQPCSNFSKSNFTITKYCPNYKCVRSMGRHRNNLTIYISRLSYPFGRTKYSCIDGIVTTNDLVHLCGAILFDRVKM